MPVIRKNIEQITGSGGMPISFPHFEQYINMTSKSNFKNRSYSSCNYTIILPICQVK